MASLIVLLIYMNDVANDIIHKLGNNGDGILERFLFPIVEYSMIIKREKPLEIGTTENELWYSIPGAP